MFKNNSQKGAIEISTIAAVIIVAAIAAAVSIYVTGKYYEDLINTTPSFVFTPKATPTPIPNETADWKTYRNEKYGFEFKYPSYATVTDADKIISLDFNFGSDLKNAANFWNIKINEIKNYSILSPGNGYIMYDFKSNKWYTTDQTEENMANKANKIEEFTPKIFSKSQNGINIYGGDFSYSDVGVSSSDYLIVDGSKNLIIDFSRGVDENEKDSINQERLSKVYPDLDGGDNQIKLLDNFTKEMEKIQNQIDQDFSTMLSTFKFTK